MKSYFLVFLSLLLASCSDPSDPGTVVHNVNGYTLNGNGELVQFEALAIRDGKVEQMGADSLILAQFEGFERVDGEGNTLLPGLVDAHAHVMGLGYREMNVNVTGLKSLEETVGEISSFAEANPDREWIVGRGWNQVLWESNEFPTASNLDEIVSDRPVYLTRIDGHAAWANSRALEIAGIDEDTEDPQGGRIVRDDSGKATGILIDTAMNLVEEQIPEYGPEEMREALQLAMESISSYGITSVHDAGIDADTWELYKEAADNGELLTRIYAMIGGTGSAFDQLSENGPIESYADDMLSLRSVKVYTDGALGSRGAAMLRDYHDDPGNSGLLFHDQQELNEMLMKGAEKGYQMNVHAIGDAANRQVLNGFAYVYEQLGEQCDLRHRIEHAQIVAPEDIPRFRELCLIASMQPTHATSDMNMAEDRVGPDRMEGAYAWQAFLDQGTLIAGGSDFPVEHVNPFFGLYSAVTRQDHGGMPPGGWYSEHQMSRIEAFRSFTLDAAAAGHQEQVLGTLEAGKWADFILIDRDLFTVPASEIWQTEVLETWVAGENVYSR